MMKILAQKIIITLPVLVTVFFFVIQADSTLAYFSNVTRVSDKTIAAGYLDGTFNDSGWKSEVEVTPGEIKNREIALTNSGSLDFQYLFEIEVKTGSDDSFCDALQLQVTADNKDKYQGSVSDFNLITSEILEVGNLDEWNFVLSLPASSSNFSNSECRIEIVFDSWQVNLGKNQQGFSLTESLGEDVIMGKNNKNLNNQPEIVINEIMWAGSSASSYDQWIELRNLSDQKIDVGNWVIENAKTGGDDYILPQGSSIAANDFFLITRYSATSTDSALAVSQNQIETTLNFSNNYENNGQVVLKNDLGDIIDKAPEPTSQDWPAGEIAASGEEKRWSMQRGANPGEGSDSNNWHTCDREVLETDGTLAEMESYWKEDHQDVMCGTPGHMNFSSNDLTKKAEETKTEALTSNKNLGDDKEEFDQEKQDQPQKERSEKEKEEGGVETDDNFKKEDDLEDNNSEDTALDED